VVRLPADPRVPGSPQQLRIGRRPVLQIHTSGHASRTDLLEFATRMSPRHLVPIHSFDWDSHAEEFPNVRRLKDGEPFTIP